MTVRYIKFFKQAHTNTYDVLCRALDISVLKKLNMSSEYDDYLHSVHKQLQVGLVDAAFAGECSGGGF